MDEHEQALAADVAAAAAVHAAKREVDGAIAALAASPLDKTAADRMRAVLASPKLDRARRALARIQTPHRHLSVVAGRAAPAQVVTGEEDQAQAVPVTGGGAA